MSTQEYELAFVTTLPRNVKVVDPSTLDFARNPVGALAFRYKHGWILINPLIPSRGKYGGALARWHGHKSGGFTTGRFFKGSDGKIKFKAEKNYGSKEEWQQEVKSKAAAVSAKQAAAKEAVAKAEKATNRIAELEAQKAPKEKLAAAHKEAAAAHLEAVEKYKAMGKGGLKSGMLTHSAHGAIHTSKAAKLEQEIKAEKAAKAQQRLEVAKKLATNAHDMSAKAKASDALPKDKAAMHLEAAAAHKAAEEAHLKIGAKHTAEAHALAASKHELIAEKQQKAHEALEKGANTASDQAAKATKGAKITEEEQQGDLVSQIAAHQKAADAHGQAYTAHSNLGNLEKAEEHKQQAEAHKAQVQSLKEKQQAQQVAKAENDKLIKSANASYKKAFDMPQKTPEEMLAKAEAFEKAAQKAGAAIQHGSKHDLPGDTLTEAKLTQAQQLAKKLKAEAKVAGPKQEAYKLAMQASGLGDTEAGAEAHKKASKAFAAAQKAAEEAGLKDEAKDLHDNAVAHLDKSIAIENKLKQQGAQKDKPQAGQKVTKTQALQASVDADKVSDKAKAANTIDAHYEAVDAHAAAAVKAKEAGLAYTVEYHKEQIQKHADAIKQLKEGGASQGGSGKAATLDEAKAASSKAMEATKAASKANTKEAHLTAAEEHLKAAETAQAAGTPMVSYHKEAAKNHIAEAEQLAKAEGGEAAKQAAGVPTPPTGAVPEKEATKPVGELKFTGKILGTHGSKLMEDEAGNKWLHKTDEYSRSLDPAVAALHRKLGLPTPVFVKTKEGHLQKIIPDAKEAFPGYHFGVDTVEKMPPEDIMKMLQHQVLDYTTGNQDSHNGQWLKSPSTGLIQIDQGQSFKFGVGASNGDPFKGDGGKSKGDPLTTYGPNAHSAVYPALWQAAKEGKIKIPDPYGNNEFADLIKKVENFPEEEFKRLFTPYAKQAIEQNGHYPGGHKTVDSFLNAIVQHKNSIGKDFKKLYDSLPPEGKAGDGPVVAANGSTAGAVAGKVSAAATGNKAAALKALTEAGASGKPMSSSQIQAAKQAGASLKEISDAYKAGKASPAGDVDSHLTEKQKALKALAELSLNPPKTGTLKEVKKLKDQAVAAGASPAEAMDAFYDAKEYLASLPKPPKPSVASVASAAPSAPSAPSAPAKKAVDPFKPKAKWSKVTQGIKTANGTKEVQALQGPKGLTIHKGLTGKGWVVSSPDGKAVIGGAKKFKTQKEAKLAAEWLAKKYGGKDFHSDSFQKWKTDNPQEYDKIVKGIQNDQWNKDAQAELDAQKAQAAGGAALSDKEQALKKLAEHSLPDNDHWDYDTELDLQAAAKAAGASNDEIQSALNKPKTYLKSLEGKASGAAAPSGYAKKPSTPVGTTGWKKTTHPATGQPAYVHPETGFHVSKKPYGSMWQLSTPDGKVIGAYFSMKDAKLNAANLANYDFTPTGSLYTDEIQLKKIATAFGKDSAAYKAAEAAFKAKHGKLPQVASQDVAAKPYKPGSPQDKAVKKMPPDPVKDPYKLSGSMSNDAHNLKAILAANGPDSQKYKDAKAAWEQEYGKTFDPSYKSPYTKKIAPPPKGFKPGNPTYGKNPNQKTTDPQKLREETVNQWSKETVDQGYQVVSFMESLHGDWKPDRKDTGPNSGPMIYSGGSYTAINQQLRGDADYGLMPIGPKGGDWDEVIAHTDKLFEEVPPLTKSIVLSRKVGKDGGAFPPAPPYVPPGAVFQDDGYVSTSKTREVWSGAVQMEVRVPAGLKVLDLNHTTGSENANELEVLLPRGTRYRVISDGPADKSYGHSTQTRHIVVEVLPPATE